MASIPVMGGGYAPAGSGGQYQWTVDPAAYAAGFTDLNQGWNQGMINNYLQPGANWFQGMGQMGQNMISQYMGQMPTTMDMTGINQFIGDATGGRQAWDQSLLGGFIGGGMGVSDKIMADWMGQFPQIQGVVSGATSGYEQGLRNSLRRMSGEITSEVGSQMAGLGSLYSGATGDFVGKRVGEAEENAFTNLAQLQAGLTGQLGGAALGAIQGGASMGLQGLTTGLGAAMTSAQQNLAAQQAMASLGVNSGLGLAQTGAAGYGGVLGNMAGLQTNFVAPDLAFQPTWWQGVGQPILNAGISALGTIAGGVLGGPMGASLGGSLGGAIGGLFGGGAPQPNYGGGGMYASPNTYYNPGNPWGVAGGGYQ